MVFGGNGGMKMRVLRVAAGFMLVVGLAGCGSSDQKASTPSVMPDVLGHQLDVALSDIKTAGFEDEVDVSGGGTFGIVDESNWKVCNQSPAAGKKMKSAPKLTVDRSCDNTTTEEPATTATTETETTEPTPTEPPTTEPPATTAPPTPEVLTTENNPDLAALLVESDSCGDPTGGFASKYQGRTIKFDGNIGAIANHDGDVTRFDILVLAGDFSESSQAGPTFQFRDVNIVSDLGLTGPNIPDSLGPGANLRFTAVVGEYNGDNCLFFLDPVSTEAR